MAGLGQIGAWNDPATSTSAIFGANRTYPDLCFPSTAMGTKVGMSLSHVHDERRAEAGEACSAFAADAGIDNAERAYIELSSSRCAKCMA